MRLMVLVLFLSVALPAWAQDRIGQIAAVRGEVTVLREGAARRVDAGAALFSGDRVATGADGRALLQLEGGLTVTVASATELALSEVRIAAREASFGGWLELLHGLVRAVLTTPATADAIEIRTPLAVTSVRSTEWTVEHGPEHTAVFCRDGVVVVRAAGESVALAAGEGTDVRGTAAPTAPVSWGAPRVAGTIARSSFVAP